MVDRKRQMELLRQYSPSKNTILVLALVDGLGGSIFTVFTTFLSKKTLSFDLESVFDYSCSIAIKCHFFLSIEHRYSPFEPICGSV